jgi:hypothetical protein|tara:strand:- start:2599 stop:3249 length:651 start_codon:yes stop_codon:yes gene_type:complete
MDKVLFGSKIYSTEVNPNLYKKDVVLKHILQNYKIDKKRNAWDEDSDLHHSYNDWNNKKFKHPVNIYNDILKPIYKKIINEFFNTKLKLKKTIKYNFSIANYTCVGNDQFMKAHRHLPNLMFTCVHYIQFDPKQHKGIRFYNTNDFGPYAKFLYPNYFDKINSVETDNSFMFEQYDYIPKEDELIIFHCMLPHEIPKQKNVTKPRIAIIINIEVKK